ncbi:GntR family transcriptional regulator [Paenibacillus cisolokensis]|jgi:DNA-binding GntR family transcriptional regulator|uniref:GntR family transcriptional regulator n=1 Tax=Paenibacillus cisolokensis TaxID=1658519 RepID=A0ABQ4NFA1_9BACL|nr:GntR family transcriptional regulator [Paenibacillus cisolokensis]GIQ66880.1 GntR family transcriptional regulator [Paenibacillus cisolokensis]
MDASNVKHSVYTEIREAIIHARLEPGQRLSEADLAVKMNVSRTPVREAFISLSKEGLVEILPQRGTFVTKIDLEDVRQSTFIRESLEISVLGELIKKITPEQIARLKENVAEQEKSHQRNDYIRFYELDEEFHRSLAEMSGHGKVWDIIKEIKVQMDRVRLLSLPIPSRIAELIRQHFAIIQALEERNADKARETMVLHLQYVTKPSEVQEKYKDYFIT